MIDLGSIAGLHRHQLQLACYRIHCDRWALLDLAAMIDAGYRERRLPIRMRCEVCGEIGRLQVRAPVPLRGPADGWSRTKQKARHEDELLVALAADAQAALRLRLRPRPARPRPSSTSVPGSGTRAWTYLRVDRATEPHP
jgi:hypothetical protein